MLKGWGARKIRCFFEVRLLLYGPATLEGLLNCLERAECRTAAHAKSRPQITMTEFLEIKPGNWIAGLFLAGGSKTIECSYLLLTSIGATSANWIEGPILAGEAKQLNVCSFS